MNQVNEKIDYILWKLLARAVLHSSRQCVQQLKSDQTLSIIGAQLRNLLELMFHSPSENCFHVFLLDSLNSAYRCLHFC